MKKFSLETKSLSKTSDRKLIDNLNFSASSGEMHAIIGNNGEGKTVFAQVLAGVRSKTSGQIFIDGREVFYHDTLSAQSNGIYMVQQEIQIFPDLTVWENLIRGNETQIWGRRLFTVSNKKAIAYCQDVLDLYGLDLDLYAQADQLNQASQRLVQLVHTLICKPRVLILDEFSTFLNSRETQLIFRILEILKAQNTLIVIITHKYSEICKYCDGVSVITDGTVSASFHKADFDSEQFITQIADLNMDFQYPKLKVETGPELIHITTTRHLPLEDLDFKLHKREIIGITGLSSQEKRLLYSFIKSQIQSTSLIPERTAEDTIFRNQSLPFNIVVSNFKRTRSHGLVSGWKINIHARHYLKRLGFHNIDIFTKPKHLSSGNQQKLLLARSLFNDSTLYFYDEPTKTLDATSRLELYNIMNALIIKDASVLLLSSDYSELVGMCSRVIVFQNGKQIGNYATDYLSSDVLYKKL